MSRSDAELELTTDADIKEAEQKYAELHEADVKKHAEAEEASRPLLASEADILELYRRAQLSVTSGYTVARGEDYAAELGGSDGSPASLVELCEAVLGTKDEAEGDTVDEANAAPEDEADAPEGGAEEEGPSTLRPSEPVEPVEAAAEPVGTPVLETPLQDLLDEERSLEASVEAPVVEAPIEEDDAAGDESPHSEYESWSKKRLLAEAEEKGVEAKASMTKAEIVEALRSAG
jgi:hypothetical protein